MNFDKTINNKKIINIQRRGGGMKLNTKMTIAISLVCVIGFIIFGILRYYNIQKNELQQKFGDYGHFECFGKW